MWPTKEGLGSQLGFGLEGPNIYVEHYDEERPWIFSREIASGLDLKEVGNSTKVLVQPQIENIELDYIKKNMVQAAVEDTPDTLLSNFQTSSKHLDSEYIYDPAVGKLFGFIESPLPIVVYVSSSTRSQLVVRTLAYDECHMVPKSEPDHVRQKGWKKKRSRKADDQRNNKEEQGRQNNSNERHDDSQNHDGDSDDNSDRDSDVLMSDVIDNNNNANQINNDLPNESNGIINNDVLMNLSGENDEDYNTDMELEDEYSEDDYESDEDLDDYAKEIDLRDTVKSLVPTFGKGCSLKLSSPIQQIEMFQFSALDESPPHCFFVRTSSKIFLIEYVLQDRQIEDLIVRSIITRDDLFGEELADMSTNIFKNRDILVTDVKGNWTLFEFHSAIFKLTREFNHSAIISRGTVNDFTDFSRFKRISYCDNQDEFYLMSRSYLKKINVHTGSTIDLITAKRWSEMRDFCRSDIDETHAFLLTSRELIWIDVSNNFKRLLSWKHNLDADDPSLSMIITHINDVNFICVYSQAHPVVLLFQLKMEDDLPKSIHDPILMKTDYSTVGQSYIFVPFYDDFCALFKLTNQLEISRNIFSPKDLKIIKSNVENSRFTIRLVNPDIKKESVEFPKKVQEMLPTFSKMLFRVPKHVFNGSDEEAFEKYIYSFELDNARILEPLSLLKYTEPIQQFDKFTVFDEMIFQLYEYFKENNTGVVTFHQLSDCLMKPQKITSFQMLFDTLTSLWQSSVMAREATRDAALSLSIVYDEESEQHKLEKRIGELPGKLAQFFDCWDNDNEDATEKDEESSKEELMSQQPTIKITQSQPSTQNLDHASQQLKQSFKSQSSNYRNHIYGSQAIMGSQFNASQSFNPSQSQKTYSQKSSSQKPHSQKKKKKIRGFA